MGSQSLGATRVWTISSNHSTEVLRQEPDANPRTSKVSEVKDDPGIQMESGEENIFRLIVHGCGISLGIVFFVFLV